MHNTLIGRLAATAALAAGSWTLAADDFKPAARMLRYPDVSATHICFVYANDIWIVPKTGGTASPLASPPGMEILPKFSPDGKTIAFVGNYDGNRDIYTVSVDPPGSVPVRVTHHPAAENLCDWTPDSKLLFFASGLTPMPRQTRLFTVAPTGGLPEPLPMPYSGFGCFSPDARQIVFSLLSIDNRTWKRYRGGMAPDLWILDLASGRSTRITDWEGTDTIPMWHKTTIYYLSDNGPEHRLNVWAYDTTTTKHEQVTTFTDDDVRWPSLGPGSNAEGEIVFQLGSELRLLNLGTRQSAAVRVILPGARQTIRPRQVDAAKLVGEATLSPTAKRVLFQARGDIWSVPAKEGVMRNVTRSTAVMDRSPAWSPDGKWIAYFSDATGEYELYVRRSDAKKPDKKDEDKKEDEKKDADAKEGETHEHAAELTADEPPSEPRKLTDLGPGFRWSPVWSPDSKMIAFRDHAARLQVTTVESGQTKVIDTDPYENPPQFSWSSDSKWLAYTRSDDSNLVTCLWLCNIDTDAKTRVTSPMFGCSAPTFDRAGKYLFFSSNRAIADPIYSDIDNSFVYTGTESLMLLPLAKDTKSPWTTRSDEEELKKDDAKKDDAKKADAKKENGTKDKPDADKKDEGAKDDKKDDSATDDKKPDAKKDKITPVKIDLDAIERRAVIIPIPAGTFGSLAVTHDDKLIYGRRPARGQKGEPEIKILDLKDDAKEEKTVVTGYADFELASDAKKILVAKDRKFTIHEASAGGGKAQPVSTAGMTATIDPRAEWHDIFTDAWRMYRDFFYEPTMHGVDWQGVRDHYAKLLDDCTCREDVNWVLAEMISELNIGHAYVLGPGDVEEQPTVSVGMLGCDFDLDRSGAAPAYRITTIYEGGAWDADARPPLAQPGIDVKPGDYLLAVDGVPVDASVDPWAAFLGKAGKPTTITVNAAPTMDGKQRDVLVTPLAGETDCRYRAWIEKNRAYVAEKSAGKIAYLHVPDTGVNGQNNLFRQFFGQRDRAAMIIDERWNGGGQIPSRFIELLNRPATNGWARRYAKETVWPPDAHHGPKCMLINGSSGSGGDCFPAYFRAAKLGKIIGRRTWGGLVGIDDMPRLLDGGAISVPMFAYYKLDGTWGVEGHGVDPDIDVIDDPGTMLHAEDPQLDAAIEHLLKELETKAFTLPKPPPGPDRRGMGIPEKDR